MTRTPIKNGRTLPLLTALTLLLAAGCGGNDGAAGAVGGPDTTGGEDVGGGAIDDAETSGAEDVGGTATDDAETSGAEDVAAGTIDGTETSGGDLCADVVCDPIEPSCLLDGVTLQTGGLPMCEPDTGECGPISGMPIDCSASGATCEDGECVGGDLCANVTCSRIPAYCDGDIVFNEQSATCDPFSGECLDRPGMPPQDCSTDGGTCVDGKCINDSCEPTETFYYLDDGLCFSCKCPDSGLKSDATCATTSDTTLCGVADLCTDVACEPTDGTCEGDIAQAGAMTFCDPDTGDCLPGALSLPKDCTLVDEVCLEGACVPPEEALCTPDESFEASDGCNTCICPESGQKSEADCTKIGCACGTSADCAEGYFCNYFQDDCGAWGGGGTCNAKPEACDTGGVGACSCGGLSATNGCELNAAGEDVFEYGGCSLGEPDTFACGDNACSSTTEYCTIWMSDGGDGPAYESTCDPLPMGCSQGDCSCLPGEWEACLGTSGHSMAFYPGG